MEEMYYYWLHCTEGIGRITMKKILEATSPKHVYEHGTDILKGILPERNLTAIEQRRNEEYLYSPFEKLQKDGIKLSYYGNTSYPPKLYRIPDAPIILYEKGNAPWRDKASIAVVGTRACSSYGKNVSMELGQRLAESGFTVISGMARGIDGICQWSALKNGGISVGVLGSGVNICYPREHRQLYELLEQKGAILSEATPFTQPAAGLFPLRNRIISGLADAVVVIESREKSGTLITVDMALEQGKEVYCIPGRITDGSSSGCNRLIRQGAEIILSIDDFIEEIRKQFKNNMSKKKEGEQREYSEQEGGWEDRKEEKNVDRIVLQCMDTTPLHLEEILGRLKDHGVETDIRQLAESLMDLYIKGKVKMEGMNYYYINPFF